MQFLWYLQIFRQLGTSRVAWIHGDEDANSRGERDIFALKYESLFLISYGILNRLDL